MRDRLYRPLIGFGVNEYHPSMAQSLKTKYLLLALGVGAALSLLLGGFAYYEHRIDTADISQVTYATVAQKLEGDLQSRANSASKATGALVAPALAPGNSSAVAAIAGRLLEEPDIERVEVTDAGGAVLFTGSNPQVPNTTLEPLVARSSIPPNAGAPAQRSGGLSIWVS